MTRRQKNNLINTLLNIGSVIMVIIILFGWSFTSQVIKREEVTFTVQEKPNQFKFRAGSSSSSSSYRFFVVTEKETFEVRNALWAWEFDKSDRYYRLKEGKKYKATVCGFGRGFLTGYRNILSYKEIK